MKVLWARVCERHERESDRRRDKVGNLEGKKERL